jgi:hypothetical protein
MHYAAQILRNLVHVQIRGLFQASNDTYLSIYSRGKYSGNNKDETKHRQGYHDRPMLSCRIDVGAPCLQIANITRR